MHALPRAVVLDIHTWLQGHYPGSSWDCDGTLGLPLISPNGFAVAFGMPQRQQRQGARAGGDAGSALYPPALNAQQQRELPSVSRSGGGWPA